MIGVLGFRFMRGARLKGAGSAMTSDHRKRGHPCAGASHHESGGRYALGLAALAGRCNAKKRGPLQGVPVIARAIADRLGYVVPCHSKASRTVVTVWCRPWYSRTSTVPGLSWRCRGRSCRARLSKNLRLSRSRPPKARSCRRAGDHATQQVLAQSSGGHASEHQPHCRRSASTWSERMRSISAAIAAGSRQRRRIIKRPAEPRRSQTRWLLARPASASATAAASTHRRDSSPA
jgi:hypothetical protein